MGIPESLRGGLWMALSGEHNTPKIPEKWGETKTCSTRLKLT